MTFPDAQALYNVIEATWPPASTKTLGPWTIRDGQGGGKRVSAATADARVTADDIALAEDAMLDLRQPRLFMIREGDDTLDMMLRERGYDIIDPVTLYACPIELLTRETPPRISTFAIWEPLRIMEEIWADGGIGPARLAVMQRAKVPKTGILGRVNDRAAGTAYVALLDKIAMLHALEVAPAQRRHGVGINMMRAAAHWAQDQGATHFSAVVTNANTGANALYASLGMSIVGHYHYRIR